MRYWIVLATAFIAFGNSPSSASAAGSGTLKAVSGKVVCSGLNAPELGDTAQLCVTKGKFAHDLYEVRVSNVKVVSGIDDATTKGIKGQHNGKSVVLKCTPILTAPKPPTDAELEVLRSMQPKMSREQLKQFYNKMYTTEDGRHCAIQAGKDTSTIDVRFD